MSGQILQYEIPQNKETSVTPINNIQDMWNAAIVHKKELQSKDTVAIRDIYNRMDARLTSLDIATVISSVYADDYWVKVRMDPSILAKSMVQAIGLSQDLATRFAKNAMSHWRGIFVRKNASDSGVTPALGNCCLCIDVVCNENNELEPYQLINDWNNPFWNVSQTDKNYVYLRCQNLNFPAGLENIEVRMYNTDPGFAQVPTNWRKLHTVANPEDPDPVGKIKLIDGTTGPLKLGARAASEGFVFVPKADEHFCIAAVVSSEYFSNVKNDPLKIEDNFDFAAWISCNGAAGWHNLDPKPPAESILKFNNLNGREETLAFEAHCNNVPQGTEVALKFNESHLQNLSSVNSKISRQLQIIKTEGTVPANYHGNLKVLIKTPDGKPLPKKASIDVRMVWVIDHTHERYLDAADMLDLNSDARALRDIRVPMGSFTFLGTSKI